MCNRLLNVQLSQFSQIQRSITPVAAVSENCNIFFLTRAITFISLDWV